MAKNKGHRHPGKTTLKNDTLNRVEIEAVKAALSIREKYFLLWALTFAFTFGILGDLLARHWFEMLKTISDSGSWFTVNLVAFLAILSCTILLTGWMIRRMRSLQNHYHFIDELMKSIKESERAR